MQPVRFSIPSAITFLGALLISGPALAQKADTGSANYVMTGCRAFINHSSQDPLLQGLCFGLIEGVAYLAFGLCVPPAVNGNQMMRVVVQYIDSRPARLHEDFKMLALEALNGAWPCKK